MPKAEKRPNQCELILKYIRDFGSITSWQAYEDLGVIRLPSRIFELKEAGYEFSKKRVYTKNRYGIKTYYDEFYLKEQTGNA
ncbi:MAG: helix-turn-helix domain-containing protein [Bacteroidaceae bacterium]|nr:helix-turn-helix domain-containing protein [Bacteroidaceae bacterium]